MKFNSNKLLTLTVAATPLASAHYTFSQLVVNDELVGTDWQYIREHTRTYMPIMHDEIPENDFRCNKGASSGANTQVYTVRAGDKVALKQAYGGTGMQHPGPTQVYMSLAPSGDVASYNGSGAWFKVFEGPAAERRLVHVRRGPHRLRRARRTSCAPSSTSRARRSSSRAAVVRPSRPLRLRFRASTRRTMLLSTSASGEAELLTRTSLDPRSCPVARRAEALLVRGTSAGVVRPRLSFLVVVLLRRPRLLSALEWVLCGRLSVAGIRRALQCRCEVSFYLLCGAGLVQDCRWMMQLSFWGI